MAGERFSHPKIRTLRHTPAIRRESMESSNPAHQPFPIKSLFRGCSIEKTPDTDMQLGAFTSVRSTSEPKRSPFYSRELKVYHDGKGHETGYTWTTYNKDGNKYSYTMTGDYIEGQMSYGHNNYSENTVSWHLGFKDGKVNHQHYGFPDGMGQWDIKDLSRRQIKQLKKAGFDPNLLLVLSKLNTKNNGESKFDLKTLGKLFSQGFIDEAIMVFFGKGVLTGYDLLSQGDAWAMKPLALFTAIYLSSVYKFVKDMSLMGLNRNDSNAIDAAKSLAWKSGDIQLLLSTYTNSLLYPFKK